MSALTVAELKEKLKERNLPSTGSKNELLKRLLEAGIPGEELSLASEQSYEERIDEPRQNDLRDREMEILRRERELAEREVELLRREVEMLRATPRPREGVTPQGGTKKWKEVKELIGDFDGSRDFDRWENQILKLITSYGLEGHEAKALVCSRLTGRALKWYHSRTDCVDLTYVDLLREMKTMYGQRADPLTLRRELEARKWAAGEAFADYLHDKVVLANRIPTTKEETLSYIVEGIPNQQLRTQAKVQRYQSIDAMLTAFAGVSLPKETPHQQTSKRYGGAPTARTDRPQSGDQRRPREAVLRCYNCNETGHLRSSCSKPKREWGSCFKCGKPGHRASECRAQTDVNLVAKDQPEDDDFRRMVELRMENKGGNYNMKLNALIDSGSPICFVKEHLIPREYLSFCYDDDKFYGINGCSLGIVGRVEASIVYNQAAHKIALRVVPDKTMRSPMVLGRDFMKLAKLSICDGSEILEILNIEVEDSARISSQDLIINEDLPNEVKMQVRDLFDKYYANAQRPLEPAEENIMKLTLTDDKPFSCTPFRLMYSDKPKLRNILDDLLDRGIIRESTSEYASPIVLTRKKNGETRMCIDFRKLNKVTARDNFPIPLIEDQLDLLGGKKYFTTLDLKDGFFHIKMHEDSTKYTSFVTSLGQFEYTRMPFGLKGAPLRFQRYVTQIFKNLIDLGEVSVYFDDILIATETMEHHLYVLEKVCRLLVANLLELRVDKCRFLQTKLEYLGYTVTEEGIQPTNRGIEAIMKFPAPRSVRDVQSFLGLCSYFRKFVENFSIIAKPLYDVTRKNVDFRFGEAERNAFETLKDRLTSAPILSIYSPRDETELHCDASAVGFGAILLQKKADRKLHPVFYFSRRTTDIESRYHSFELETLAIIYALRRFRTYLFGMKFKIITDCQALSLTLNKKETNPRISRWVLELQNYDYTLEHRSGSRMLHVDALSRQVLVIEDNSFDRNLALCQSEDPEIERIRAELEKSESKLFEMRDGCVYRKDRGQIRFYVPAALETNVMYKYHNEMGHVGTEKTVRNISDSYWFPNVRSKVGKHIKHCLKCIAFTPATGKPEGLLHTIPKGDLPFLTLHVDHLAPAARSHSSRNQYIFSIVDAFTKYVKLYVTKDTSASGVIKCLRSYFEHYSRPLRLVSDRGSCFTSRDFEEFLREQNIQHIRVATASPQANGQVERFNRTILPIIAKLADERKTRWHNVIGDVEFACNNTVSKTTNECPSVLLYGVRQRGNIIDELRDALEASGHIEIRRDLHDMRKRADRQIQKNQETNKRYYDRKHKTAAKYQVGDKVMIRNIDNTPGASQKLIPRFKGPYQIDRILKNDRYVIKDVEGFQLTQTPYYGTWGASNIRLWNPN